MMIRLMSGLTLSRAQQGFVLLSCFINIWLLYLDVYMLGYFVLNVHRSGSLEILYEASRVAFRYPVKELKRKVSLSLHLSYLIMHFTLGIMLCFYQGETRFGRLSMVCMWVVETVLSALLITSIKYGSLLSQKHCPFKKCFFVFQC